MAQLIVIPIDEETDAVLIVILREDQPLIGYVTKFTLESFFHCDLTAHDCVRLVDSKIDFFEQILAAKSLPRQESKTPCIQVELSDLRTNWEGNR